MNLSRLVTTLCAVVVLSFSVAAESKGFKLSVNDVSGLDAPWPMIGGLPFPEGELHDPARIRIVDEAGNEVPAQIDVAATWRDGSIRWALVGLNASPQGDYQVEYGPDVSRSPLAQPLTVRQAENDAITIDTRVAVYEFLPDRLLPESGRMGDTVVLSGSGDGAYLIDNQGRLARVAGAQAEIETEILKQGPVRTVIRRTGWYVTDDDERVARARMWFYFTGNSPFVRMTHSIVFTEDTNDLWIRDYGLDFRTPEAPEQVVFALSEPGMSETSPFTSGRGLSQEQIDGLASLHLTELPHRAQRLHTVAPGDDEVYMLQDDFPHLLEREYRGVVGRVTARDGDPPGEGNLWVHDWILQMDVAGDWGEARYDDHALTVVSPQLALRFPKEIAFGPNSARVALWSGRSGRELDFRCVTLVNEYWQSWAYSAHKAFRDNNPGLVRGERAADLLAAHPSNAQGAARTHDVWLLPRTGAVDDATLRRRALAASFQPLVQADPVWLASTEAIGWPIHPLDEQQFPREEQVLQDMWKSLTAGGSYNAGLRRTGFISWGQNANLHAAVSFFRISRMTDYNLRRNVWNLFVRGGERSFYEYGSRFNQFMGDWELAHWTAGEKRKGEFVEGTNNDLPLHWGSASNLRGSGLDVTGHTVVNWLLEYYLTGNEYPQYLAEILAQAYREQGETQMEDVFTSHIYVLAALCAHEQDETLRRLAENQVNRLIDLDNPTGLNEGESRHGVYYKTHRSLLALYDYYRATGDERAREAFLKGVEDKFNYHLVFDRTGQPGSRGAFGRSYSAFLFSIAYQWTGRRAYLQVVNQLNEEFRQGVEHTGLLTQMAPFMCVPTALGVLAGADGPIAPFPIVETGEGTPIVLSKAAGKPIEMRVYVHTSEAVPEQSPPAATVQGPDRAAEVTQADLEVTQMFQTRDAGRRNPRRWHVRLTLPAEAEAGSYSLVFPNAATVVVLESDADDVRLGESNDSTSPNR